MKETIFLYDGEKVIVPRPTSVGAGYSRYIWLKDIMKKESVIASPEVWDFLTEVKNMKVHRVFEKEGIHIEEVND